VIKFKVGDKVFANFEKTGIWYPGKIEKDNENGTYNIKYDDGDKENNVETENIRPINIGDKVFVNVKEKNIWIPGKILNFNNNDNIYNIEYDDTEKNKNKNENENKIEGRNIRLINIGDKVVFKQILSGNVTNN
jgi:hypothetical protein